jgi:hypothetical protein
MAAIPQLWEKTILPVTFEKLARGAARAATAPDHPLNQCLMFTTPAYPQFVKVDQQLSDKVSPIVFGGVEIDIGDATVSCILGRP